MSATSQLPVNQQSTSSQPPVHQRSTTQPPVNRQSTSSQPPVNHQSTTSQPPVNQQSTTQSPVNRQSASGQLPVNQHSTTIQSPINHQSNNSRSAVNHHSTTSQSPEPAVRIFSHGSSSSTISLFTVSVMVRHNDESFSFAWSVYGNTNTNLENTCEFNSVSHESIPARDVTKRASLCACSPAGGKLSN